MLDMLLVKCLVGQLSKEICSFGTGAYWGYISLKDNQKTKQQTVELYILKLQKLMVALK